MAFAARGQRLPQRVQPVIEGLVIVLLLFASAAYILPLAWFWAAVPAVAAGLLVLLRLFRWQLFSLAWHHADICALGSVTAGWGWAWCCSAATRAAPLGAGQPACHYHGALGTLSSTVMLRLSYKRAPAPGLPTWRSACCWPWRCWRAVAPIWPGFPPAAAGRVSVFWSLNYIAVGWCMVGRWAARSNRLAAN